MKKIKIIYKIKQDSLDKQDGIIGIVSFGVPENENSIPVEDLHKFGAKKEVKILCKKKQVSDELAIQYEAEITEEQIKDLLDF